MVDYWVFGKEKKRLKKSEPSLTDLWDSTKATDICHWE
jgi:hypothetical protein